MTAMTPTEVSSILGIKPSTLRKYCLLLEEQGVQFERNANNSRKYSDMDLVTLQKMMTLMNNDGVTVEDAVFAVSSWVTGESSATVEDAVTDNGIERHNDDIAAALVGEIRSLKDEIKEQRETIDGFRLAQEKRDTYFVEILEELQGEIHRLNEQAAALPEPQAQFQLEPEPEPVPEKKSGFFSRFFK